MGARHHSRHVQQPRQPQLAFWLSRFIDLCLAGQCVAMPLFMGGRGAVGQLVFVALACLAALAWSVRATLFGSARWRWSGAEWLMIGGLLLVLLQLVPLPQHLLLQLAPSQRELLPLWISNAESSFQLGEWSTLSLTPDYTRGGLVIYVSYILFFLVLLQRLEGIAEIKTLLRVVASSAVLMAIVGLLQFFSGSERFLGIYEHPSRTACAVVRGTFQNENHFAHFLSLGLGPLLWWLSTIRQSQSKTSNPSTGWNSRTSTERWRASMPLLLLGALVLVALAGLLTFSRGGVLTLAMALGACVFVMFWRGLIDRRTALLLTGAGVVNLAAMVIFGYESLSHQMATIVEAKSFGELFSGRLDLWSALVEGIQDFYLTGTGVGSHREVYPLYMQEKYDVEFTHGESGYLPLLLETGGLGLALMTIGIVTAFTWAIRPAMAANLREQQHSRRNDDRDALVSCACAILPGLLASVFHSIADFVWYIPACMTMTVAQMAVGCRLYQLARDTVGVSVTEKLDPSNRQSAGTGVSRFAYAALVLLLAIASGTMLQNRLETARAALDWHHYLHHSTFQTAAGRPSPAQEIESLASMERSLTAVLRSHPTDARAHLRLAAVLLRQFELVQRSSDNPMELSQIRDAALASRFSSKAEQDAWLHRALGQAHSLLEKAQYHSRTAVCLSPLQGLGYIQLSELSFLESPRMQLKAAYLDQAARVRPHSGPVQFARGKEAALAGDVATALQEWKKAFKQDPEIRQAIIDALSDQMPAGLFIASFEPDTPSLEVLFQRYAAQQRQEDATFVAEQLVRAHTREAEGESPRQASIHWDRAHSAHRWLGDYEAALQCIEKAVAGAPLQIDYRLSFALLLQQQRRFPEAIEQLEWCLRRRPEDESIRSQLANAKIEHAKNEATPRIAEQAGRS